MTELKPCPFCGSKHIRFKRGSNAGVWLQCENCFTEINLYRTEEEAIEAWNRRVTDDK